MPVAPLTRRFGYRAGRTTGSKWTPSKFGRQSTVFLRISERSSIASGLQARLGVAIGRRRVAVERAEVAVPVHERRAQREGLRHAHHRVVDRDVAVRVVLADDVAHDGRGLLELRVRRQVEVLEHREEDAALHGLEAVAHVRQRARRDDREGVVQVPAPGLLGKRDLGIERQRRLAARVGELSLRHGTTVPAPSGSVNPRSGTHFVSTGVLDTFRPGGHAARSFTVSTPADPELFARIADGDRDAFGLFYDRHAPVLFGFCVRILKDARDAEDVLQEAFIQVWRDARRFDATRASVKTWLFTIARSRALDRWRSRHSIEQRFSAAPDESLDRAGAAGDGGQEAAALRDYVSRCLEKLSENEQAVLRLAYFDGYTQEEIAARLNEPLGTVKSRTRSGLTKLRAIAGEGGAGRG